MRNLRLFVAVVVLAAGFAVSASANTIWNLNNVQFVRNGIGTVTAVGFFEINTAVTGLVSWDINVTGTIPGAVHHYKSGVLNEVGSFQSSSKVSFANWSISPNPYLILDLAAPMTNAGGTISLLTTSLACDGCGVLTTGSVTTAQGAAAIPEPASLGLLATGLLAARARMRSRRK